MVYQIQEKFVASFSKPRASAERARNGDFIGFSRRDVAVTVMWLSGSFKKNDRSSGCTAFVDLTVRFPISPDRGEL